MKVGDTEANIDFLVDTFLEAMEEVCERCMSNRMMCALRPACPNRKFLNLLIRFGVDTKDLPSFCYEQQITSINTFLEGSSKAKIIDTTLPIKEFMKILSGGGERLMGPLREKDVKGLSRELFIELKRATPDVFIAVGDDYILALVDEGIYYFDLTNEIVIINPRDTIIKSNEMVRDLINIFRERYKLNLELREEFEGLWYLNVAIPLKDSVEVEKISRVLKEQEQKFLRYTDYVSYYFSDDTVNFVLEIKTPTAQQKFDLTFKRISSIFAQINNLVKQISQSPQP
ncbi:MAG: hypothetical protein KIH08_05975 [Candidatus Freyarchaeota archaeon]|nr:hypothetical protein [Candidatus Jordarchaeia archaeon]MBS7280029.1 hypothetical protein [Candidatus Jordarchaeia archaeon]